MARGGGEVKYRLVADADGVTKGTAEARKAFRQLKTEAMDALGGIAQRGGAAIQALSKLGTAGLAAGATIGAAVAGVTAFGAGLARVTKEAADFAGAVSDISSRTGVSVEALQKLGYAGSLVGVSMQQTADAVSQMQRRLVETPKAFQALQLSAADLRKLAPEDAFAKIAENIQRIPDSAGKAAAAMAVFGKSGAELLPLLTSDIGKANAAFEQLGMGLAAGPIAALDELGDSADTLKQAWTGMWRQIGAAVADPQIIGAIQSITSAVGGLARTIAAHRDDVAFALRVVAGGLTLGGSETVMAGMNARAGMSGAGGSLSALFGGQKPGWYMPDAPVGGGGGGGAKPPILYQGAAGDAADAAAKRASAAWVKAAEEARTAWDRFRRDLAGGTASMMGTVQDTLNARARRTLELMDFRQPDTLGVHPAAWNRNFSGLNNAGRPNVSSVSAATVSWDQQLQRLANTMQAMGSVTGQTGQRLAAFTATLANIGGSLKGMKGGGFLEKALGGLGIASSVIGFIGGLFGGGPSKAEKAAEHQRQIEEAKQEAERQRQDRISGLGGASTALSSLLAAGGGGATGGTYAVGIFAALTRETGNVVKAIQQLGPALDQMAEKFRGSSAAFDQLLGMSDVLKASGMGDQISALQDLARGLAQGGIAGTPAIVGALAQDTTSQFHGLMGGGASASEAFAIMQPMFQQLWEQQQKRPGSITDEGTLSLLQQAQDQGLVGDEMRTGFSAVVDVLEDIRGLLGGGEGEQSIYLDGEKVGSFARRAVVDGLERGTDGRLLGAVRNAQAGG